MKNTLFILLILTASYSCSSSKSNIVEKRCPKIFKNNYSNIISDKFISVVQNDTIKFNEIKYECVHSAMYTKKVMYDKYGMWDKEVYSNTETRPNLIWNNIRLFDNDEFEFTIVTRGVENATTIYASIMIFDNKNNDLLSNQSQYKDKLIELFSHLIFNNNLNNEEFYDVYWKKVDPVVWKINQKYKKTQ